MYINYIQNKIQVLMCSRYIVDTVSRKMDRTHKGTTFILIGEIRRRLTIHRSLSLRVYSTTLRRYLVRKIFRRDRPERRLSSLENSALMGENRRQPPRR